MTVPAFSNFSTCFDSKNQTTKICHWQVLVKTYSCKWA